MNRFSRGLLCGAVLFCSGEALAAKHVAVGVGLGAYSTRGDRKVATSHRSASAKSANVYPLLLRYEYELGDELFITPQAMLTVAPLKSWDESYTTVIHHLVVPLAGPIGSAGGIDYGWSLGAGLIYYEMKGKGGTTVLRNGTGTMEFAVAEGTKTSRLITTDFGLAASIGNHRFGLDLVLEALLSKDKRASSYLVGYTYRFGGSY